VVEDATDIILNLKQVPFKVIGEGIKTVRLVADKAVKFSRRDSDRRGRGSARPQSAHRDGQKGQARYRNAPEDGPRLRERRTNFDEDLAIGYIPIDSVHSRCAK